MVSFAQVQGRGSMRNPFKFTMLLFLIALVGCAGMKEASKSDLRFQKLVEAPGFTRDQLLDRARSWIAENLKWSTATIEHKDNGSATLVSTGVIKYPCQGLGCLAKTDWKVHFTMRVDAKDGRLRLTFDDLLLSGPSSLDRKLVYRDGFEFAALQLSDLDSIKPELLEMGNQIVLSLKQKHENNW
jgi:hypothetical protein